MNAIAAAGAAATRPPGRRVVAAGLLLCGAGALVPLALPGLDASAGTVESAMVAGSLLAFLSPLLLLARAIEELKATRTAAAARRAGRADWAVSGLLLASGLLAALCASGFAGIAILALGNPGLLTRLGGAHLSLIPAALGAPVLASLLVACFLVAVARRTGPRAAPPSFGPGALQAILLAGTFLLVLLEWIVAQKVSVWLGFSGEVGTMAAGFAIAATLAPARVSPLRFLRHRPASGAAAIAGSRRKHAAVAFSDLEGFTALTARDERAAHLAAQLLHNAARAVCKGRGLRVVKSMGDAVMLEGPDAYGMAEALLELHAAFPALSRVNGIEPLALRSGVHAGEVTQAPDGDLFGRAVNLAARLQGEAPRGEVACTLEFAKAAGLGPERLRWLGERTLKNVTGAVACFAIRRAY